VPKAPKILAVSNQKGGEGKTTTAVNLAASLAVAEERVLLVDLDPQGCLTWSTGTDPDALEKSLHDVFLGRAAAADVLVKVGDLAVLPANIDLAGAEVHLMSRTGREYVLRRALDAVLDDFDLVLVDCPPSLGILTINGLTAAAEVLVPLQCETLSHRGVGQLLETIEDVRTYTNPGLAVRGVIATMFDGRTNLARLVVDEVRSGYGLEVLEPPVPKSVKVAEAPGHGRSVLDHAPRSKAAEAYRQLAAAVLS
jgi:chromosome partitioning protein